MHFQLSMGDSPWRADWPTRVQALLMLLVLASQPLSTIFPPGRGAMWQPAPSVAPLTQPDMAVQPVSRLTPISAPVPPTPLPYPLPPRPG